MAAETLESELLAIVGVASAEVDEAGGAAPAGVRVRLEPDADARAVGVEVQRVLAAHGMRSRFSSSNPPAGPPPTPPLPPAEPPPTVSTPPQAPPPIPEVPETPTLRGEHHPVVRSVTVEEREDGLTVAVTMADGATASRDVGADGEGLEVAVIGAVAAAAKAGDVTRAAVEWIEMEDGSVVTVVLRRGSGSLVAGAGVVRVGKAYAIAIATAVALAA